MSTRSGRFAREAMWDEDPAVEAAVETFVRIAGDEPCGRIATASWLVASFDRPGRVRALFPAEQEVPESLRGSRRRVPAQIERAEGEAAEAASTPTGDAPAGSGG